MHKRLDGSQNPNLVDIDTPRQAHKTSRYQYPDKIHHSNGLDIAIAVPEVNFHNAPFLPPFLAEHTGGRLPIHGSRIQEAKIHDTIDDLNLLPSAGNPAMHNAGSTWVEVDIDVQKLSTNGVDFSDEPHVVSVISPSTIFPAELSPLARIGSGEVLPQSCTHAPAIFSTQPLITRNGPRFFCDYSGCFKSYSRHSDMRRHALSHNTAAPLFFCRYAGCRRGMRGFVRKDKLMAHIKAVHGGSNLN